VVVKIKGDDTNPRFIPELCYSILGKYDDFQNPRDFHLLNRDPSLSTYAKKKGISRQGTGAFGCP
jgi:hypothetical protein